METQTSAANRPSIVVAGHICLDIIPALTKRAGRIEALLEPGKLIHVGPAVISTGGAVSNTGLALHRLGVPTTLMGKVGDDLIGHAILDVVRSHDPALTAGMIVDPQAVSSYTVVINPPDIDRIFLHCPGANDTFGAADVPPEGVAGARIFHFGYPPIMRRMYLDDGAELAALLARTRAAGVTISLDMAYPDPASEAGRVDWRRVLERVLPHVDLFVPSYDEMVFMLDREAVGRAPTLPRLSKMAAYLIELGAAVVMLKLGDQGLYLHTTSDGARLRATGAAAPSRIDEWRGRELLAPCFTVEVAGTTGAGDCTIAGFLAALWKGLSLEEAAIGAVAVGGCSVESADATGGVPSWKTVQTRLRAGWPQRPTRLDPADWRWSDAHGLWVKP